MFIATWTRLNIPTYRPFWDLLSTFELAIARAREVSSPFSWKPFPRLGFPTSKHLARPQNQEVLVLRPLHPLLLISPNDNFCC
jgi:hypothetical protein